MNSGIMGKKKAAVRTTMMGRKEVGTKNILGKKAVLGSMARRGQSYARTLGDASGFGADVAGIAGVLQPELAPVALPTAAGLKAVSLGARFAGSRTVGEAARHGLSGARYGMKK